MGGLEKPILVFLIKIYERPGQSTNSIIQSMDSSFPEAHSKWHKNDRIRTWHSGRNQDTTGMAKSTMSVCLKLAVT